MKRTFLILLSAVMLLASCGNRPKSQNAPAETQVPADSSSFESLALEDFMKAVEDSSVLLLDVRTAEEHAEGCIPGTDLNIDVLGENFAQAAAEAIAPSTKVALYCRSGNRSKKAAAILSKNGYEVVELSCGYKGWKASQE